MNRELQHSKAISIPSEEEIEQIRESPSSFSDSFEKLSRSALLSNEPVENSQILFENLEKDFESSQNFLSHSLSSSSSLIPLNSSLIPEPEEKSSLILLNSSLGTMENIQKKESSEDISEASFGFFGNTGEKEEETERNEQKEKTLTEKCFKEHPEMSESGAIELQEIAHLQKLEKTPEKEENPSENSRNQLNSSSEINTNANNESNWTNWLGVGVYSTVKTYVMNCFYQWMPHASLLPEFSDSTVYMIKGRQFKSGNLHLNQTENFQGENNNVNHVRFEEFIAAFRSLFWFSYRNEFEGIQGELPTSDAGWGCMLRSGQMILAQALACHFLGKEWELDRTSTKEKQYFQLIRWFLDFPTSPYSVHKIAQKGIKFGKKVGEWFGPSTVSQVLSELVDEHTPGDLVMYTSNDSTLYLDEIQSLCTIQTVSESAWNPLFVLIPLRLGLDSLNPVYHDSLCKLFQVPQFLGIVGGKPRAAMFFVACQDTNLFYLDPHTVQTSLNASTTPEGTQFDCSTFHSAIPHKMNITSLDPSLSLGFYCEDKSDFEQFWKYAQQLQNEENPLFGIQNESPDYRYEDFQSTRKVKLEGNRFGKKLSSSLEKDVVLL